MSRQVMLGSRDRFRNRHGKQQIAPLLLAPANHVFPLRLVGLLGAFREGQLQEKKICDPSADQAKACTLSFSV